MVGKLTVYLGDIFKVLPKIPENSIDCIITSPPYWKQRDYKHPDQIGQERSYTDYSKKLIEVFCLLKRVLKPTGTFFLFVKEESKYQYYLSIDELRIPVPNKEKERNREELIGMEVRDSLQKDGKEKGVVKEIYKDEEGDIFVRVLWENGNKTIELVQDFSQESQLDVELLCQSCQERIKKYIEIERHKGCKDFPLPVFPPPKKFDKKKRYKEISLFPSLFVKDYRGKYLLSPESRGQSPGARLSLFGEYLVRQRRYKIHQPLIADYLRHWRQKQGIATKEIDQKLGYSDTAGHWFRKDTGKWGKGGSVPLPEDWWRLKEILSFDDIYDR